MLKRAAEGYFGLNNETRLFFVVGVLLGIIIGLCVSDKKQYIKVGKGSDISFSGGNFQPVNL